MHPLEILIVTIDDISYVRVESVWKSCFKSNCPFCHCEDAGSKGLPTILDLLMVRIEIGVPQMPLSFFQVLKPLLQTVHDFHLCLPKWLLNADKELCPTNSVSIEC